MVWTCDAMGEERIPKKMLHTKMEGKQPREYPDPNGQTKLEKI